MASIVLPEPPVCRIDATGIHQPAFAECLAYFTNGMKAIFGQDIYLGLDSQDGQLCSIPATALHEANSATVATYNAFAPSTAQGVGLSRSVKINGLRRFVPTYSTADVLLIGVAGTVIENGIVGGENGTQWSLPPTVAIPLSGEVMVTATCTALGAIAARANTLTTMVTTTRGWQSVTNSEPAALGAPVERDASLRRRQSISTELPSRTILGGIIGGVASIPEVVRLRGYENVGHEVDENGLPPRSFALVVEGGDVQKIADAIGVKKSPGATTYGTTSATYVDETGISRIVRFFRPHFVPITARVRITAKGGYSADVEDKIKAAVVTFANGREIGEGVDLWSLGAAATLPADPGRATFKIEGIEIARDGALPMAQDVGIAFNEAAYSEASFIEVEPL